MDGRKQFFTEDKNFNIVCAGCEQGVRAASGKEHTLTHLPNCGVMPAGIANVLSEAFTGRPAVQAPPGVIPGLRHVPAAPPVPVNESRVVQAVTRATVVVMLLAVMAFLGLAVYAVWTAVL